MVGDFKFAFNMAILILEYLSFLEDPFSLYPVFLFIDLIIQPILFHC
jgi:hypothetical protein